MIRLIVNRIFATILVLIGVSFVVFAALHFSPGDVARTILGLGATEERSPSCPTGTWLRSTSFDSILGLDDDGPYQGGDLGRSISLGVPVSEVIFDKIWASLLLMGASFFLTVSFGLLFAALSGGYHRSLMDRLITLLMLLLASLPPFLVGIVLLIIFGLKEGFFPISGWGQWLMRYVICCGNALDPSRCNYRSVVTGSCTRVTRSAFIDEMGGTIRSSRHAHAAFHRDV